MYICMEQVESLLIHEVLGCVTVIILIIFFYKVKILALLEELPSKEFSIFYN
jgi:hypothetical protein